MNVAGRVDARIPADSRTAREWLIDVDRSACKCVDRGGLAVFSANDAAAYETPGGGGVDGDDDDEDDGGRK